MIFFILFSVKFFIQSVFIESAVKFFILFSVKFFILFLFRVGFGLNIGKMSGLIRA